MEFTNFFLHCILADFRTDPNLGISSPTKTYFIEHMHYENNNKKDITENWPR